MSMVVLGVGISVMLALFAIANSIKDTADAIKELAHEVHVYAQVMEEIKHQGIG